ncbi:putative adhesin [Amycolatopsis sp. NBC_00345]|uniref:putative adhesin n=1 Tax=Amycolatopsis sp. NBC_00345 TaxID=2975955 RepID=UPI003FA409E8
MTTIVSGHGEDPDGGTTFVPRGQTVRMYTEHTVNLRNDVALTAILDGARQPAPKPELHLNTAYDFDVAHGGFARSRRGTGAHPAQLRGESPQRSPASADPPDPGASPFAYVGRRITGNPPDQQAVAEAEAYLDRLPESTMGLLHSYPGTATRSTGRWTRTPSGRKPESWIRPSRRRSWPSSANTRPGRAPRPRRRTRTRRAPPRADRIARAARSTVRPYPGLVTSHSSAPTTRAGPASNADRGRGPAGADPGRPP